jgi:hypothetical protein
MGGDCTIPTLALELPARILMCRQGASGYNLCCHSRIVGDREPRLQRSVSRPDNGPLRSGRRASPETPTRPLGLQ